MSPISPHPDQAGDEQRIVALSMSEAERFREITRELHALAHEAKEGSEVQRRYLDYADDVGSLSVRYEDGVDEATVIGSYLCRGCHDKILAAFPTQKDSGDE